VRSSCLPLVGQLHRQGLAGELPENPSTKNSSLNVGVASARPHDARRSPLASSSHSAWPVDALGRWAARWWTWGTATWDLTTPTSERSLRDVEDRVLKNPYMHHLPY
jgi:hypothetical protein